MMKRIFIAIPAAEQFQKTAMKFSLKHAGLPVRWLQSKNLHITLVPPMVVSDEQLNAIAEQLISVAGRKPFTVSFNQAGFGPSPKEPRLIWTTGSAPAELLQLKEDIEHAITYTPERPQFMMHVTLARFPASQFQSEWKDILQTEVHFTMLVDRFVIMESIKQNGFADYQVLETYQL